MCYALQGNTFQDATTEEELKIGFKYGFKVSLNIGKAWGRLQSL